MNDQTLECVQLKALKFGTFHLLCTFQPAPVRERLAAFQAGLERGQEDVAMQKADHVIHAASLRLDCNVCR